MCILLQFPASRPVCAMGKAKLGADQFTQPQLDDQHRIGRNETVNSRRAISKMRGLTRTCDNRLVSFRLRGVLDAGHRLTLAKSYRMIHPTMAIFPNPDHFSPADVPPGVR